MVFFAELSKYSRELLRRDELSPALKLYQNFVRGGRQGKHGDCMKCIFRMLNNSEATKFYGMFTGWLVSTYNSTPFLATDSPSYFYEPGRYLEFDLDGHLWPKLAKKAMASMNGCVDKLMYEFGFVIEGRTDDETPEQMLAVVRISKAGIANTKTFPYENQL